MGLTYLPETVRRPRLAVTRPTQRPPPAAWRCRTGCSPLTTTTPEASPGRPLAVHHDVSRVGGRFRGMLLHIAVTSTSGMNASAWVAVAAAAIALIAAAVTYVQARHVKRQADAAEKQTTLQEAIFQDGRQPYVWADFRLDETQGSLMQLMVRNEGPTVARDVRILFDPPLQGVGVVRELDSVNAQLAGV